MKKHTIFRLLAIALLCLIATQGALAKKNTSVVKLSKQEREDVVAHARAFLLPRGADVALNLTVGAVYRNHVLLKDWTHRTFAIVARDSAAECLKERVLAFSMGTTLARDHNDEGIYQFLNYYDRTLQSMREGRLASERALANDTIKRRAVPSLLKYIKWRQFHLRNQGSDIPKGSLTGCGPTALAQIMAYYHHPMNCIDWERTDYSYVYPKGDTASITPLLVRIGRAVKAEYGVKGTGVQMDNMLYGMVREFDFSPRAMYLCNMTERDVLIAVHRNLLGQRPSLMCGRNHLFVCDGYHGGYFHLNMGWSGNYDGWYRFITPGATVGFGSMLDGVIVNIVPRTEAEKTWVEVDCPQPGTLPEVIGEVRREDIGQLRVKGSLNGRDIHFLRQMAGYVSPENLLSWHGALTRLDLSEAKIVADSAYYFRYDAAQYNLWLTWNKKRYQFNKMTHDQWLEIAETRAVRNNYFDVVEVVADSLYQVSVKTQANTIGQYMFCQCHNLREVKFPRSTRSVSRFVLHGCPLLESVTLPAENLVKTEVNSLPKCRVERYGE
ncbi:MAG: C10 family peptidase [Bacteroidales bacterium]|nr:C10 family peptidase [Bacteroidales bacterium]